MSPARHLASRLLAAALLATAAVGLTLLGPVAPAAKAIPLLGRDEILARAESGLGTDYTWGREAWVPNAGGIGPDCSGYVLKTWEVPRSLLYEEEDPDNAAIEPRYRAVVLVGSGLPKEYRSWIPEANPINFAAHIRAPKILVQGRYDEDTPLKTAAEPLFRLMPESRR